MYVVGPQEHRPLRIWLLGQFRLEYGERQLAGLRPRCEILLAYLLLCPRSSESRHHLAFLLWPDSTERQALTNLRHVLHDLRSCLPDAVRYLAVTGHTIAWNRADIYLDVEEFQWCARPDADPTDLERGLAVYVDDLLPACYDDWIAIERRRLRQQYYSVVERLAHSRELAHDWRGAIDLAERLLAYDPLREATYRLLIRLHAANNDRAAALQVYQSCVAIMGQEFGAPVSATTEALGRRLKNASTLH